MLKIRVDEITAGENEYWLKMQCYIPSSNPYTLEFCGTEIQTNAPILDKDKETIKNILQEQLDCPPYKNVEKWKDKSMEIDVDKKKVTWSV